MKKIFMLAGEVSGDQLGAWLCSKRYSCDVVRIEGVGGPLMQAAGVAIIQSYDTLNSLGISEIVSKIPFYYRFMHWVVNYLREHAITELVLIDYPGMNLRLARMVKRQLPQIHITFAAPPQTWCWGAWRIKTLRRWCDEVVVLYPFEIAWYEQHGLRVTYLGSPVVDRLQGLLVPPSVRALRLTIAPGSRHTELLQLLPIAARVSDRVLSAVPTITIALLCPATYTKEQFAALCKSAGFLLDDTRIIIVCDEQEKRAVLSTSCAVLVKPGTVTLEAGLLQIPGVIFFVTSWINHVLARMFMTVAYRGLPNLLTNSMVMPECMQQSCTPDIIAQQLLLLCHAYQYNPSVYAGHVRALAAVRKAMHCDDFV